MDNQQNATDLGELNLIDIMAIKENIEKIYKASFFKKMAGEDIAKVVWDVENFGGR